MIYNSYDNVGLVKVLNFLKTHNSEYLSGQDLSDVLKISRVAIWKHIKKIRELGYKIESKQKLGYLLTKTTNRPLPWEVLDGLETKSIGRRAYYFDTIDSTQNFAMSLASNSNEDGAVIISERQTGGRGRMGRKWISPTGGIWLSVILHPKFDISMTTLFPIASSLALVNAIEKIIGIKPKVKWPNDVTTNGKKVAGMLVDVSLESNKIENMVLGVGINFDVDVSKIEKQLKNTENFYGVSSLNEKKKLENSVKLIQQFLYELEKVYEMLNQGKTNKIIKKWTEKSSTIGKNISIKSDGGKISGKATKIDSDGALVIQSKNKSQRVLAGDVTYIKL